MSDSCNCSHKSTVPSVQQTLAELDFERGIWSAALDGDYDKVNHLLSKGTPVDMTDNAGYTALHYAARAGDEQICLLLIRNGANVNSSTKAGQATPLHRAAMAGREKIVELLLKNGATCVQDIDGRTPLHRAVESGHVKVVKLLVQNFPQLVHTCDYSGKLPADFTHGNELLQNALQHLPS